MKKFVLTTLSLGLLSLSSQAQFVRFGVKGGAGIASANLESVGFNNVNDRIGFNGFVGGLAEFSFNSRSDKFKMQVEANYNFNQLNTDYEYFRSDYQSKYMVHSITIPVLAKYFFTPSFSMYLGPSAHLNVGGTHKYEVGAVSTSVSTGDDLQAFQIGGMLGANYYIYKGFFVEARYNMIAPELTKSNVPIQFGPIHNVTLGLGYKF
jgi:hypothetical protein